MAFPGDCIRVVLGGTLAGGEVWSAGFYRVPAGDGVTMQSLADAFVTRPWVSAFKTAWSNLNADSAALRTVTMYKYTSGRAAVETATASFGTVSGVNTTRTPNYEALVTTLRTADTSRSGRGRMYWPLTGGLVQADGLLAATAVQSFLDQVKFMLQDSSALVVSETRTLKLPVTSVTADRKADVMRSRQDKLVSNRLTSSLA